MGTLPIMPLTIACPADSRVAAATILAEQLRLALAAGDDVVIDLSAVESTDLGLVQVIEAARLMAGPEGTSVSLTAPVPASVHAVLDGASLLWAQNPDDLGFWHLEGAPA